RCDSVAGGDDVPRHSRCSTAETPMKRLMLCVTFVAAAGVTGSAQHSRLFPPTELGSLEVPDREDWQQPERIMDALRIGEGTVVADLGAGGGWFTIRLARR